MDDALRALYQGSRLEFLFQLCIDCDAQYCFFAKTLSDAGSSLSRDTSELFDPAVCPHLQEVLLRTPLTDAQLVRKKLASDLRYQLGLAWNRNPSHEEVVEVWNREYEGRFMQVYGEGVRDLAAFRRHLFSVSEVTPR